MDGFEAKRDLKLAAEAVAKPKAAIPNQGRVALDDDAAKLGQTLGDCGIFGFRDGLLIKETAGVVEFDLAQLGQTTAFAFRETKRKVDLFSDRLGGRRLIEGVLPEIAHEAAPRAFLVGEKNRHAIDELAVGSAFLLEQPSVGAAGVERVLRAALPDNPAAAGGRGFRIKPTGVCGGVRNKARGIFDEVAPRRQGCFLEANRPTLRRVESGVFQKQVCRSQALT